MKASTLWILLFVILIFIIASCSRKNNNPTPVETSSSPTPSQTATQAEIELFNNGNVAAVGNGPTAPTVFTFDKSRFVTKIMDYHWNSARGSTPGTIGLKDANGKTYGPWQTTGRDGQGGVKNAYWDATSNTELPAGTYTVIDSEPSSWAQNSSSKGIGMTIVWGY